MDYDGLWMTLWIASGFMTIIYVSFAGNVFIKYRSILDPFQKVSILIYCVAFVTKTIFWVISWQLAKHNESIFDDTKEKLFPIQSTMGAIVSAISFIILQVIIFRIFIEYD
jgi:hypothetical protein